MDSLDEDVPFSLLEDDGVLGLPDADRPVLAGAELDLGLTQAQLAARLGTVRELVARALSQLEEGGVIARKRRVIVIRDPTRLAALARGEQQTRTV